MNKIVFCVLAALSGLCFAQPRAPQQPPAGTLSTRPSGGSLGMIRLGASSNLWFGWQVGTPASSFAKMTFLEAIAKADSIGLAVMMGSPGQRVAFEIPKNLDSRLMPGERAAVVARMRDYSVQMHAYRVESVGAGDRALFEFARDLGVRTIVTASAPAPLAAVDQLANEFGVDVAIENRDGKLAGLEGASKRIGIFADVSAWAKAGVKPGDAKERLMGAAVRDPAAGLSAFALEAYRAGVTPLLLVIEPGAVDSFERAMLPAMAARVDDILKTPPGKIRGPERLTEDMKRQIDAATPRQAQAKPKKPRKMLVTDIQMYSGHSTIPHGNLLLELMGKYTGAFEPVFSNDLDNLRYPKIKEFDAVFLNNVCGMVFPHADIRESILRYVREGGGIGGNHAVTYANLNWPEFMDMIGAWAGAHQIEKQMLKIDDPDSPLTAMFDRVGIEHTDEFYHFPASSPYTREKQHILMSIDVAKSDMATTNRICKDCARPDHDYGVSWIKSYGKGRVYITPLGHTTILYTEPKWTRHLLAAIQFMLGDLDADTTPSRKAGKK